MNIDKTIQECEQEIEQESSGLAAQIVGSNDLLEMELPETEWLIEKLIPAKTFSMLVGDPSAFKSWIMLAICSAVSKGRPLFGHFKTKQTNVLYIDEESSLNEIKRRWNMVRLWDEKVDFMSLAGFKLDNPANVDELVKLIKDREYGLVIMDSLRVCHDKNENDSSETRLYTSPIKRLNKAGACVFVIHHNKKASFNNPSSLAQMLRGSSALLGDLDAAIAATSVKETHKRAGLVMHPVKLRQGKTHQPFKISIYEDEGNMMFEFEKIVESDITAIEKAKYAIKKWIEKKGESFSRELTTQLNGPDMKMRTIETAIAEMKKEDELVVIRIEGKKKILGLP